MTKSICTLNVLVPVKSQIPEMRTTVYSWTAQVFGSLVNCLCFQEHLGQHRCLVHLPTALLPRSTRGNTDVLFLLNDLRIIWQRKGRACHCKGA